MADEADMAQAHMEREEEMRRRLRESCPPPEKIYHTECNWCGDPTEDGARYCSKDCASDAFRYQCSLKRNGISL